MASLAESATQPADDAQSLTHPTEGAPLAKADENIENAQSPENMHTKTTEPDERPDAAAKKRAKNKAKKARQKAKAKAPAHRYVDATERRASGPGRGMGLFATSAARPGDVVSRAVPALSTIFDAHATAVCGFCFRAGGAPEERSVTLVKKDGRVGVFVNESVVDSETRAVVAALSKDGPNAAADLRDGDVLVAVDGKPLPCGAGARDECLAALAAAGDAPKVAIRRPALRACRGCGRFAICRGCDDRGRRAWHEHECAAFRSLPVSATKGETSPLRMMLRYRAIAAAGDWCAPCDGGGPKEPLALVETLQASADVVPPPQRAALSKVAGIPEPAVAQIIGQIRGNAGAIFRGGAKVGCALGVHMGYTNHDCDPNCAATVDDDGYVALSALKAIDVGAELTISYVDAGLPREERRHVLKSHYEFDCACARCSSEARDALRARARTRGKDHYQNTSKLARDAYLHSSRSKGGKSTGV